MEPGYCDLNEYHGKPLLLLLGGISPMGKSIRNASNLKTWFLAKKKNKEILYDCKLVMLLLTFHKERTFSLKKISLSFSHLQLGPETVAPCIMQRKLSFFKKKQTTLETTRIRFQFSQTLCKEAECGKLQVVRPRLLQFIKKIVKSGFVTSRLEPVI